MKKETRSEIVQGEPGSQNSNSDAPKYNPPHPDFPKIDPVPNNPPSNTGDSK
jgi:hypothetical protein